MSDKLTEILQKNLTSWVNQTLFTIFSVAHANRFRIGRNIDPDDVLPDRLTVRSGTLLRSLSVGEYIKSFATEAGSNQIREVSFEGGQLKVNWGTRVIYSAVHEYGAIAPVTSRMRSFFWRMYYETGKLKWLKMALKKQLRIPSRPYFLVALQAPETKARVEETLRKTIEASLGEFIGSIKK